MRFSVVFVLFNTTNAAYACPGQPGATATAEQSVDLDPAGCAKRADLMGSACSYSTGVMASRVLEQGEDVQFVGPLMLSRAALSSRVAVPYRAKEAYVIANEVVESVDDPLTEHSWTGKILEVEGVQYMVITKYSEIRSG